MKIQLDQNGNSNKSQSFTTKATGILLTRKGRELTVDIGNRATPHAIFAALTHMRSIPFDIYITSRKSSLSTLIPLGKKLNASDTCLFLSRLLMQQVESRQNIYATKELKVLNQEEVQALPLRLQSLCNLKLARLDTATALAMIDETAMEDISFIIPSNEMSYADNGYQVRKLPRDMLWPTDQPYVPLAFSQLLTAPYAPWYNCLCHTALCVRRPLIHRSEMRLVLPQEQTADPNMPSSQMLPEAQWYNVTRILYPLASHQEKPSNFRLLICSLLDDKNKIIL